MYDHTVLNCMVQSEREREGEGERERGREGEVGGCICSITPGFSKDIQCHV